MNIKDWKWDPQLTFKEFSPDPDKPELGLDMDPTFMEMLYSLRKLVNLPMSIGPNGGYSLTGHASGSAHYTGKAADIQFRTAEKSVGPMISHWVRDIKFNGVGFYEHWKPSWGFHVDIAPRYARWIRTADGKYISLT